MQVLKVRAVAAKLGVHTNTVYVWVRDHGFPKSFLIGGSPVWDEADVDQWLVAQKEKHNASSREAEVETN
jgi:predicted DNA-binding transcriptional regulator AlpA